MSRKFKRVKNATYDYCSRCKKNIDTFPPCCDGFDNAKALSSKEVNTIQLWVITLNEWGQGHDGEYFIYAYDHKPTFQELKEQFNFSDADTGKLSRGEWNDSRHLLREVTEENRIKQVWSFYH